MSSKWANDDAFTCHCCHTMIDGGMNQDVLDLYDAICDHYQFALNPNCGYRCVDHNREVGGAEHSYHVRGMAIDVDASEVEGGVDELGAFARSINPNGGVIEYHDQEFVHIDCRGEQYHDVDN